MISKLVNATTTFKKKIDNPSAAKVTPTSPGAEEESRNATVRRFGGETKKGARGVEPSMARLDLTDTMEAPGGDDRADRHPPAAVEECGDGGGGGERRRQLPQEQQREAGEGGNNASSSTSGEFSMTSKGTGSGSNDSGSAAASAPSDEVPPRKLSSSSGGTSRRGGEEGGIGDGLGLGGLGDGDGDGAGIHDYQYEGQSPALASVDTAASTQPPPSPLNFGDRSPVGIGIGGGEGDSQQQMQMQQQYQQMQRTVPGAAEAWSSSPWGTGSALPASRPPLVPDEEPGAGSGVVWGGGAPPPQSRTPPIRGASAQPHLKQMHRRSLSWEDSEQRAPPYPLHRTASSGVDDGGSGSGTPGRAGGRAKTRKGQGYPVQQLQQLQQLPSSPSVRSWSGHVQSQQQQQQQPQQYEYWSREFIPQSQRQGSVETSPLSLSPPMTPVGAVPPLHLGAGAAQQQPSQSSPASLPQSQSQRTQQQHYQLKQSFGQQQYFQMQLNPQQIQQQQLQPQRQRQTGQYQLHPRPSPAYQHSATTTSRGSRVHHHWAAPGTPHQQPSPASPSGSPPGQYGGVHHRHHHPAHHHSGGGPHRDQTGPGPGGTGAGPGPPPPSSSGGSSSSRSSPEVLKTLLRKKACLYEPGTSHAVALVTWLVGRKLALSQGYFSRQHLQAGVHDVVSGKIEDGVITRTKVNRCMQIILNSCFHYIIPRPDGTEEDGGTFREAFVRSQRWKVNDEEALLRTLPAPWSDLEVGDGVIAAVTAAVEDEAGSGGGDRAQKEGGGKAKEGSGGGGKDKEGKEGGKRSVLLCFNENVRSAEDVFRCHNEFIRDAAHGANLLLTADEWRSFYSGHDDPASAHRVGGGGGGGSAGGGGDSTPTTSSSGMSVSPASLSPPLRPGLDPGIVIQPPVFTLDPSSPSSMSAAGGGAGSALPSLSLLPRVREESESSLAERETATAAGTASSEANTGDVLGEMKAPDLSAFRTTWCAKRYDHDATICGFAHVDVNGGWLRRDPMLHPYQAEMCPDVRPADDPASDEGGGGVGGSGSSSGLDGCHFNLCGRGINCSLAHSWEEIEYHPSRYKSRRCQSRPCLLRDVCPNLHPGGAALPAPHYHHHPHPPSKFGGGHHQYGSSRPTWHRRDGGGGGRSSGAGGGGGGPQQQQQQAGQARHAPPSSSSSQPHFNPGGAPTMYVHPAPESEFEKSLLLPGLRSLFRRRCSVLYAHQRRRSESYQDAGKGEGSGSGSGSRSRSGPLGLYSNFGDDWGLPGSSPV